MSHDLWPLLLWTLGLTRLATFLECANNIVVVQFYPKTATV